MLLGKNHNTIKEPDQDSISQFTINFVFDTFLNLFYFLISRFSPSLHPVYKQSKGNEEFTYMCKILRIIKSDKN